MCMLQLHDLPQHWLHFKTKQQETSQKPSNVKLQQSLTASAFGQLSNARFLVIPWKREWMNSGSKILPFL